MNIFFLDQDPVLAAQYHCDKHVCKMIVEYAQLLSTAHHVLDGEACKFKDQIYKKTHENHPSAVWAREGLMNYYWLYSLFWNTCSEYEKRYNKVHKTKALLKNLKFYPRNIVQKLMVDPPQCMPDQYQCNDVVQAYRNYYLGDKARFAKWKYTAPPPWWPEQNGEKN